MTPELTCTSKKSVHAHTHTHMNAQGDRGGGKEEVWRGGKKSTGILQLMSTANDHY